MRAKKTHLACGRWGEVGFTWFANPETKKPAGQAKRAKKKPSYCPAYLWFGAHAFKNCLGRAPRASINAHRGIRVNSFVYDGEWLFSKGLSLRLSKQANLLQASGLASW